jgi:hypothetical protein
MHRTLESLEDRRLLSTTFKTPIITDPLPPIGTPSTVHAEATDQFNTKLGTLPGRTVTNVSQLHGSINWGDGTSASDATFKRNADGTFKVLGTHTYAKKGTYSVVVTISTFLIPVPGQPSPLLGFVLGQLKTTANVSPDDDGGVSLTETATQKFTARVGSFDFRALDIVLDKATIDWGDGKTSSAKLVREGTLFSGEYDVFGTHTYAKTGTYKVHVIVKTRLAGSTVVTGTAANFFSTIKVMGHA